MWKEHKGHNIALLIIGLLMTACFLQDCHRTDANKIYNKKFKIVRIAHEDGYTKDKFHTPTEYRILLAQYTEDTTKYIEWEVKSAEQFYNYHVGDMLHFDFINKQRLFTIK
jgi:chromatin segregation and condensation protein Rec8/ScpA/Scc1 (kleisin family)